jgi:DNA polymerase III gamma/tau subunit
VLNVQGQDRAISHLQRVLGSGRMASTWIFFGPGGVGKFSTALALAQTCLCENPQRRSNKSGAATSVTGLPDDFQLTVFCGRCESCKAVEFGTHPDLHIVSKNLIRYHDRGGKSKGTTLSIQVIRGEITGDDSPEHRVEPKLYHRPVRGRGKWFIIDEADLMELPAQNALLKALEEPPPQSYIVMITGSPTELLSTIRSRSQIVEFRPLPAVIIAALLKKHGADETQAKLLARLTDGSLGHALSWLETPTAGKQDQDNHAAANIAVSGPAIFQWTNHLSSAMDNLLLARCGGMSVAETIQSCAEQYAKIVLRHDPLASKDRAVRDGAVVMLGFIAEWFDDRMRYALGTTIEAPLPAITKALQPKIADHCLTVCTQAQTKMDMNAHVGLVLAATTTAWEQAMHHPTGVS